MKLMVPVLKLPYLLSTLFSVNGASGSLVIQCRACWLASFVFVALVDKFLQINFSEKIKNLFAQIIPQAVSQAALT